MAKKTINKVHVLDPGSKPTWYDNNLCTVGRIQDVLVNFAACCDMVVDDEDLVKDISSVLLRVADAASKKFPINI